LAAVAITAVVALQATQHQQVKASSASTIQSSYSSRAEQPQTVLIDKMVNGIPEMQNSPTDTIPTPKGSLNIAASALFELNKSTLMSSATAFLTKEAGTDLADIGSSATLTFTGYADCSGGQSGYNKQLSLARAEAVENWFKNFGFSNSMKAVGMGATDFVAQPCTSSNNRRVEISISY